jgi:hypothetical protein
MSAPLTASLRIRLAKDELESFIASCGGKGKVSSRLRYLMKRDLSERIRKRAKAPAVVPMDDRYFTLPVLKNGAV